MNHKHFIIGILLSSSVCNAMTLNDALKRARSNSWEVRASGYQAKQAMHDARAVDAAYDTTVFANYQHTDDKSMQNSAYAGDERTKETYDLGFRKLFGTGTQLEFKGSREKSETIFEASPAAATDPTTTAASSSSSSSPNQYNPSYNTSYEVSLKQNLWRNFWGKEIDLKRKIAEGGAVQPNFAKKISLQNIQAETESLYWAIANLNAQLFIAKDLVKKSKEFATQMSKRVRLGRADNVDEASAEANVVSQEDVLIDLEISLSKARKQFELRLDPTGRTKIRPRMFRSPISLSVYKVPAYSAAVAFKLGRRKRFDIQRIAAQRKVIDLKKRLAQEEGRPSLALFGAAAQNGLADSSKDSNTEVGKSRNPTLSIGVAFEMPIGNTKSSAGISASIAEASSVVSQEQVILKNFRSDIEMAYEELNGSRRKLQQAIKKIRTFDRKRREENVKLKQARGERVTVIRYEMEVLTAKTEKLTASKRIREAEAKIRHLLHDYPAE